LPWTESNTPFRGGVLCFDSLAKQLCRVTGGGMISNEDKLEREREELVRKERYPLIKGLIFVLAYAAFWVWIIFKVYSCIK